MGLDEIEKMARNAVSRANRFESISDEEYLARAVLAMLPTIHAVIEWRDRGVGQSQCDDEGCRCTNQLLREAVDALRAEMGRL